MLKLRYKPPPPKKTELTDGLTPHLPVLQQRVGLRQGSSSHAIILIGMLDQTLLIIGTHLQQFPRGTKKNSQPKS